MFSEAASLKAAAQPSASYGWDNEYGHLESTVNDFGASKFLVSNAEFMSFVEAGGYQNQDYWTEEGWQWVQYKNAKLPQFWIAPENPRRSIPLPPASQ